jgi:hypothetical protein
MSLLRPFQNLLTRIKSALFGKKLIKHDHLYIKPVSISPPSNHHSSRTDRMIAWCRKFNARNSYRVPLISPESIYRAAVRPRKRRA